MKTEQAVFGGRTRAVAESLEFMDALYGISKVERVAIEAMRGNSKPKIRFDEDD